MIKNGWTKKLEQLETELSEVRNNYEKLLEAAEKALEFMCEIEVINWLEHEGPETLPQVDAFMLSLEEIRG